MKSVLDMDFNFVCPVCNESLMPDGKTYKCSNNHCFDIAKQGYVNLLQSQTSKNKRHGDDKLMIKARTDFLNLDYYKPLAKAMAKTVIKYSEHSTKLIDAGCGDCYYTDYICNSFKEHSKEIEIIGVDISKEALIGASKRNRTIKTAVASVFNLPVKNESCDVVLNVFSPFAPKEYFRVLKKDGILVRVVPLENHLFELKEAIYDTAYKNPYEQAEIEGFKQIDNEILDYKIKLKSNDEIQSLFKMTPYYYKTSRNDQGKLNSIDSLEVTCQFEIRTYRKQG